MSPSMDNEDSLDAPVTIGVHHDHLDMENGVEDEDNHVVVIGAGPAGLMLA